MTHHKPNLPIYSQHGLLKIDRMTAHARATFEDSSIPWTALKSAWRSRLFLIKWIAAKSRLQLLIVGTIWVLLTILFEITLGRLVRNLS
jgi:hypothetical protein